VPVACVVTVTQNQITIVVIMRIVVLPTTTSSAGDRRDDGGGGGGGGFVEKDHDGIGSSTTADAVVAGAVHVENTTADVVVENENNTTSNNKYDEAYFSDWMERLRKKLDVVLPWSSSSSSKKVPLLPGGTAVTAAFRESCRSVRAALRALKDAQAVRDAVNKLTPSDEDNKDALAKAIAAVESCRAAADRAVAACQGAARVAIRAFEEYDDATSSSSSSARCRRGCCCCCGCPRCWERDLYSYCAIQQATPKGLARFCARPDVDDETRLRLIDLLSCCVSSDGGDNGDAPLLASFLQQGGPKDGEYGRAVQLYWQLVDASSSSEQQHRQNSNNDDDDDPVLKRLALAVALELCSAEHPFDKGCIQHPERKIRVLDRYWHYRRAYLKGDELDPAFGNLTAWEMRMAINGDAPDDDLQWGRDCVRNYRPDHVLDQDGEDQKWRYVRFVRSDVSYKDTVYWKPEPDYQQILSSGAKCGGRAWFGRFILKAFGIPTWGVRQPGHAALSRWTPAGWTICLGAGFEWSFWDNARSGNDFLLETQARTSCCSNATDNRQDDEFSYLRRVLRLEMLASYFGETDQTMRKDCVPDPDNLWYSLSLMRRTLVVAKDSLTLRQSAQRHSAQSYKLENTKPLPTLDQVEGSIADKPVLERDIHSDTFLIPATSCSKPTKSTTDVKFMQSFLGGRQLFLGNDAVVEYTLLPSHGILSDSVLKRYALSVYLCTVHRNEDQLRLTISRNNSSVNVSSTVEIPVAYTIGMWEETEPVDIGELGGSDSGKTTLSFQRENKYHGIAMMYIRLKEIGQPPRDEVSDWTIVYED